MKAYLYKAALLCEECGEKRRRILAAVGRQPEAWNDESSYNSDEFPKGPFSDGGGEADNPQHCDHCEVFLENSLTSDGVEYVRQALAERDPTERCVAQTVWAPFYGVKGDEMRHYRINATLTPTATPEEIRLAMESSTTVYPHLDAAYAAAFNLWNGPEGIRSGFINVAVVHTEDVAEKGQVER